MGYNPKTYNLRGDLQAYGLLENAIFHVIDRGAEKLVVPTETYGAASNLIVRLTKWTYSFKEQNWEEAQTNKELYNQIQRYLRIKPRILPKRGGKFGVELLDETKIPPIKFEAIYPRKHTIVPTTEPPKTEPTSAPTDEPLMTPTEEPIQ